MSFNALSTITPFVSQMDNAFRTFGFDLKQWISTLDIATVGIVMLVAALGFLLFDLLGYKYASVTGKSADYHPYGRSLLTGAAEAWQNRDSLGLDPYFSGVRGRALDVDNVSRVLDAISNAIVEWESPILSTAGSTTHNTITHPKFPSAAAPATQGTYNTITHPKFPSAAAPATQGTPNEWGWN